MAQIVSDEDLFTLAETVWSSILGLELTAGLSVDGKVGDTTMTACVQITGDWEGAVTVACSSRLATRFASAMFALDADDLDDEEIRDALGEIANMTGGNVKGLAPGTNTLALPSVTAGDQGSMSIVGTRILNSVVGMCEGEPVLIRVYGKDS
jgi:chemotaxis protein CheX